MDNMPRMEHIYDFGQQLHMLRCMTYVILTYCIVVLMPIYAVISVDFASYDVLYGWTVALCYLT